jgi:cytochrome P450
MPGAGFSLADAPMEHDRAAGWRFFRDVGEVFQAEDGTWFLTSPEAVSIAHQHPELFASGPAFDMLGSPVPLIPLAIDPPDHLRYRKLLDPMLAPRMINEMESDLRRQVGDLIEVIAGRGECDVIRDIARLYPTQVFLTLFGLPLEDRDMFIDWVETIVEGTAESQAPPPEVAEAAVALFGYLQECVDSKRRQPGSDMLSRILALRGDDEWTNDEVLGLCFLFTLAGLDTVTAAIGFMFLHLAQDPDLRKSVVSDRALIGPLVEEIVRLEPPAPLNPRVTTQDVDVCGVTIPAHANCQLVIAAANRTPLGGPGADEIDIECASRSHLGFGGGIHRCLGSHLARRELRLVVEEFHARIAEYQLAPGTRPAVVWPSGTMHLDSLPIVFTPPGLS